MTCSSLDGAGRKTSAVLAHPSPFVSFVVPFYGSAARLRSCLDSFVVQTDGDFEVIVVDDASPEDAEAMVSSCGLRFRYLRQERNRSSYQARLLGMRSAAGEYVVAVDADDYVMPGLVARIRSIWREQSAPDIIVYNLEMVSDGEVSRHWCRYERGSCGQEEAFRRLLSKQMQWNLCSKAIRRDRISDYLASDTLSAVRYINISDDFASFVPILMCCQDIAFDDYVGYRYCQFSDSLCHGLLSFGKQARAVVHTARALVAVCRFAAERGAPLRRQVQSVRMAMMILRWQLWQFARSLRGKDLG